MTLRARRRFHHQEFFNRFAVAQAIADCRNVIHAVHIGRELLVGAILCDFLDAAMQIADDTFRASHALAVQLQLDAQHAVGGRVLRPHVDDQFVGAQ